MKESKNKSSKKAKLAEAETKKRGLFALVSATAVLAALSAGIIYFRDRDSEPAKAYTYQKPEAPRPPDAAISLFYELVRQMREETKFNFARIDYSNEDIGKLIELDEESKKLKPENYFSNYRAHMETVNNAARQGRLKLEKRSISDLVAMMLDEDRELCFEILNNGNEFAACFSTPFNKLLYSQLETAVATNDFSGISRMHYCSDASYYSYFGWMIQLCKDKKATLAQLSEFLAVAKHLDRQNVKYSRFAFSCAFGSKQYDVCFLGHNHLDSTGPSVADLKASTQPIPCAIENAFEPRFFPEVQLSINPDSSITVSMYMQGTVLASEKIKLPEQARKSIADYFAKHPVAASPSVVFSEVSKNKYKIECDCDSIPSSMHIFSENNHLITGYPDSKQYTLEFSNESRPTHAFIVYQGGRICISIIPR